MLQMNESTPDDLASAIIILGKPLATMAKNLEHGQYDDPVIQGYIELSVSCLRSAIKELRNKESK